MSPTGDWATLEAERDFLLRSIADLEAERISGELTPQQFDELAGAYTARAAAVLRTLAHDPAPGSAAPSPGSPGRRRWQRAGVFVGLLAVAAGTVVLIGAVGGRGAGQTITGNAQSATQSTGDSLARAVEQNPDDPQARLAYARFLLDDGQLVDSVRQFDAASGLDPTNPEALAYGGWIIALAGVTDPGLERIDRAIAADPDYPDAHMFRGMTLLRGGDADSAVTELQRYLELAPDSPLRAQVEAVLDEAQRQASNDPPSSLPAVPAPGD